MQKIVMIQIIRLVMYKHLLMSLKIKEEKEIREKLEIKNEKLKMRNEKLKMRNEKSKNKNKELKKLTNG